MGLCPLAAANLRQLQGPLQLCHQSRQLRFLLLLLLLW
jgi:hypothetical protein